MKKTFVPALLCAGALAGIAAAAVFCAGVLTGRLPAVRAAHQTAPVLVELDEAWAAELAAQPSIPQIKTYLDDTLDRVQGWGGTAVALTGLTPGGQALFRDATSSLVTLPAATAADRLFSRFDPLNWLLRQAGSRGVEVVLLQSGAAAPWQTALAQKYDLVTLAAPAEEEPAGYTLTAAGAAPAPVLRADGSPGVLAAAEGPVILGSYSALAADGTDALLYRLFTRQTAPLPDLTEALAGKTVARTLAVTYPVEDGAKLTSDRLFLMGTSDPAQPLTLNGTEVARGNEAGVWGVLVPLAEGENTFTLQNGNRTATRTVRYVKPSGGGSGGKLPNDSTKPAQEGQFVCITDAIASALRDPADASTIGQTLYQGAMAQVVESKRYSTGSKKTYAYKLATGHWVRSSACRLVDGSTAQLSEVQVRQETEARCTVLRFAGGTPAVYHQKTENGMTFTFLSAQLTGALPALPEWITAAETAPAADGFALTLHFDPAEPLYGWAVNYDPEANATELWLKRTPRLAGSSEAPLAGVTVLLDAGHGGTDNGAMGAAGMAAPLEKELNLAAATAARYRLEQLGATVWMTREGDQFPSLGDRVTALNTLHPDLFIAVHHNSLELTGDINKAWGTEAYWFYEQSDPLGNALLEQVCAATGRQPRQVKYGYYYVTRSGICPAVLLELGFVTNPSEYAECSTPASLWADGSAIAQAVYRTVAANGAAG